MVEQEFPRLVFGMLCIMTSTDSPPQTCTSMESHVQYWPLEQKILISETFTSQFTFSLWLSLSFELLCKRYFIHLFASKLDQHTQPRWPFLTSLRSNNKRLTAREKKWWRMDFCLCFVYLHGIQSPLMLSAPCHHCTLSGVWMQSWTICGVLSTTGAMWDHGASGAVSL